jgi:hypothetical protein
MLPLAMPHCSVSKEIRSKSKGSSVFVIAALALAAAACSSSGDGADGAASDNISKQCPATPEGVKVGTFVGDQLPEITLYDCEGKPVSLNTTCGANTTWLFVAHRWCPHAKTVGTFAEKLHDSLAPRGLKSVQIVYQDAEQNRPTVEDCRLWRDAYGFQDVLTVFDPSGVSEKLFDSTYTSLSVLVNKNRVIARKTHTDKESDLKGLLEKTLNESQ